MRERSPESWEACSGEKMGDTTGRPSSESSFLGDPDAKFFAETRGRSKKKEKSKKKRRPVEPDAAVEIRKEHGFPPRLEKSLANNARLFHRSHRPSSNHQLKTFFRAAIDLSKVEFPHAPLDIPAPVRAH